MKLFSWMHNKLNGRQATNCNTNISPPNKNQTPQSLAQKEEFSDWPQGLLSIGTLFNKSSKDDTKDQHNNLHHQENSPSQNPTIDFTLEEVKELQKELSVLLSSNDLNNCLSSLDAEKLEKFTHSSPSNNVQGDDHDDHDEESNHIDQHSNNDIVPNKAKDIYMNRKKSMTFLLKKMFVCGVGGLGPSPSLRDPTLTARKTSISKILRAMLRKKIYPQNNSSPSMSRKKYWGNGQIESSNYEDEDEDDLDDEGNNISKWDKSDTDYIVLEI